MAIYQLVSDIKRETVSVLLWGTILSKGLDWGGDQHVPVSPKSSIYLYLLFKLQYRPGPEEPWLYDWCSIYCSCCKKPLYKQYNRWLEVVRPDVSRQTCCFTSNIYTAGNISGKLTDKNSVQTSQSHHSLNNKIKMKRI